MKRILLAAAALATGVGTFLLVRAANAPDTTAPGATRSTAGPDAAGPAGPSDPRPAIGPDAPAGGSEPPVAGGTRPVPGQPAPEVGAGTADANAGGIAGRSFSFEEETRDEAWAVEHERELTGRMRGVIDGLTRDGAKVDVDAIECKRSLCRVSLHARDTASLSKAYGALETPEGLYGWADNVLLESVEAESDGQVKTKVTAVFNRD